MTRQALSEEQQLELAIRIAAQAHAGQFDRGGKPYILHPLHIMNQLMYDLQLATIGVLHDVTEDSDWTIDDLREAGFSDRVCNALTLLEHQPEDDYLDAYIPKIATNYDSLRVKRKDLTHNSCLTRLKGVRPKDLARAEKYSKAFLYLGEAKKAFQATA